MGDVTSFPTPKRAMCANCLCSAESAAGILQCRRVPPTVYFDSEVGEFDSAWAAVHKDDWCMEWHGQEFEEQ